MADGIILGHDNRYKDGTPVATDTNPDPDFNALNVNDLRKYTLWAGESAGQKYLYVDAGAAVAADILAIRGHNLGTAEAEVVVESSPGFSLSDAFDNGALDPVNFGTALFSGGSVVETTQLDITAAAGSDAAITYDKNILGPRGLPSSSDIRIKSTPSVGDLILLAQWQGVGTPVISSAIGLALITEIRIVIFQRPSGDIYIYYVGTDDTVFFWKGSSSEWTEVAADIAYAGAVNTFYIPRIINDGTNITIQLWDSTDTIMHTEAIIPTSALKDDSGDEYFTWGEISTSAGMKGILQATLYNRTDAINGVWTNRLAAFTPDSDGIIMRRFTSASARYWRTGFNTASIPAQLGILILGQRLQLPYSADATVNLYDEGIDADTQDDDSGELLGTTVKQRNRRLEFTISNVERAFIFGALQSFWSSFSIDRRPFIIALYPDDFPEAVWFMRNAQSYRWQTPLRFFEWVENMRFNLRGPIEDDLPAGDVGP